jgi:ParB family chromosome partitioning protein
MTIQFIPLNKLIPSKSNVRKVAASGIEGLAENILVNGLINNLSVKATADDTFEVIAGGRRHLAHKLLAKQGKIAADYGVRCDVLDPNTNAHEISLAENEMRQAMHPADQFDAFKKLADEGMGEDTIAARFGVTPAVVKQRLKLAVVSPKLLAIYRKGEMTLEQVMAFTLTDKHKQQEQVWKDLPQWSKERGEGDAIRDQLTEKLIDAANCEFRRNPATDSDLKPATVPI